MFSKNSIKNKYDDIHHYYNKLKKDYQESTYNLNYIYNNLDDYNFNKEELDDIKVSLLDIEKTLENDLYKTLSKGNLDKQINKTTDKKSNFYIGYFKYIGIGEDKQGVIVIDGEDEIYDPNEMSYYKYDYNHNSYEDTDVNDAFGQYKSKALYKIVSKAGNYRITSSRFKDEESYELYKFKDEYIKEQVKQLELYKNMMEKEMFDVVIDNLQNKIIVLNKINDEINFYKSKIDCEVELGELDEESEVYQNFNDLLHNIKK